MEIILAAKAGFCFGVERALQMAQDTAAQAGPPAGAAVFTLGPLVHNPRVIDRLEQSGVRVMEEPHETSGDYLVIRTHGVPPQVRQQAMERGWLLVDATCPLVTRIHTIVENLREEGYRVVVVGRVDHPEVRGILGYAGESATVIETEEEAAQLESVGKLGVVVQTTARPEQFRRIAAVLAEKARECRIFNTICFATEERQQAAAELAPRVDVMVVVGGRNSSNTRRLVEVCQGAGTSTFLVEGADELHPEWFLQVRKVGITAGTSTPDWLIAEVVETIREWAKAPPPA